MTELVSYTGSDDNTKTSKKAKESRYRAFLGTKKYIYWIELQSCNELHIYSVDCLHIDHSIDIAFKCFYRYSYII